MKMTIIFHLKVFYLFIFLCSHIYSNDIESYILKAFKDSIDFDLINQDRSENLNKPNFLFLDALIDSNGDSSLNLSTE